MERYGEIPKRFTRQWWSYFWYYYKWHTLGVIFTVFFIVFTCTQCAMRVKYDITMTYASDKYYQEQTITELTDALSICIDDINNDGKKNAVIHQMTIANQNSPISGTEYNSGMLTKLAVEFQAGDTYIYLFSKQEIDRLLNMNSADKVFENVEDWATNKIDPSMLSKKNGIGYAINLKGNKFFEEHGIDTSDLYMAIQGARVNRKNSDNAIKQYNTSVKVANYILNY